MSSSPQSFGALCAHVCREAKQTARAAGQPFTWDDVAVIIDGLDAAQNRIPAAKTAKPSPFGDRKAIPPTPEMVTAYSASIGYPMNGQAWCDWYAAKGWMCGKVKMKDWQAAVRNWARSGWGDDGVKIKPTGTGPNGGKDYTKI